MAATILGKPGFVSIINTTMLGTLKQNINGSIVIAAPSAAPRLINPTNGPYSDLTAPLLSSLSDIVYSVTQVISSTRSNPLKYKTVTVNAGVVLTSNTFGSFIWCDTLILNGTFNCTGNNGTDAQSSCIPIGGNGGSGGSGGGGGGSSGGCFAPGGDAGSGTNGMDGIGGGCASGSPGSGGVGFGNSFTAGAPAFSWPNGGNGGPNCCGGGTGANSSGGAGFGGASGGGDSNNAGTAGGGGGAGGGLVCIVADKVITGTGNIICNGGLGGLGVGCGGSNGNMGGGGTAALIARKYSGTLTFDCSSGGGGCCSSGFPGEFKLYQVNHATTSITTTQTNTNNPWDNT